MSLCECGKHFPTPAADEPRKQCYECLQSAITASEEKLAAADKQIGWLKGDKVKLNKSIKIRDHAMDSLMAIEDSASKKLATSEAENKRLREALENIANPAPMDDMHDMATAAEQALKPEGD